MNKTLLIGLLSVGFVTGAYADEQNPVPTYEEEVFKTAKTFKDIIEQCSSENLNGRRCAFELIDTIYDTNSCVVGRDALDRIDKKTCPKDLPFDEKGCEIIRISRYKYNQACEYLDQQKAKKQKNSI
jgi:hypothetical protein